MSISQEYFVTNSHIISLQDLGWNEEYLKPLIKIIRSSYKLL